MNRADQASYCWSRAAPGLALYLSTCEVGTGAGVGNGARVGTDAEVTLVLRLVTALLCGRGRHGDSRLVLEGSLPLVTVRGL